MNETKCVYAFSDALCLAKPYSPGEIRVTCDISSALVRWKSSFNGGDPQSFTVTSFNSQQGTRYADRLLDRGEDKIHELCITNLLSSMSYMFYVTAQNSHGHSSSEIVSCTTLKGIYTKFECFLLSCIYYNQCTIKDNMRDLYTVLSQMYDGY